MIDQINDEAIDAEFAQIDKEYQEEARRLSLEFAGADWEAFQAGEALANASERQAGKAGS